MRLFVAFAVPEALRDEVARRARSVASELPAANWVAARNLHLTLVFLGEVEASLRATLETALERVFDGYGAQAMNLVGSGTFPAERPGRVAWVGVRHRAELVNLHADLRAAAERTLGKPLDDRPLRTHLTVARCRRPWGRLAAERFSEVFSGALGEPFVAREGLLVRSRLTPQGPRYTVERSFPLAEVGAQRQEMRV